MNFTVLEAKTFQSVPSKIITRTIKDYELDMEIANGRIYSFNDVTRRKLCKGDILFRTPGSIVRSEGMQSTFILTLDFSGMVVPENYTRNISGKIQPLCDHPLLSRFEPIIHPENPCLFESIYTKLTNISDKNSPAANELVMELIYLINAEICKKNYRMLKPSENICDIALSYMRRNAASAITLEELASMVHLEKSYFARLFKKNTGHSPIDMLISIRLDRANDLVSNTDTKICDIAEMCGYNTVSFFISAYKKKYGITPEEHRRLL